MNLEDHVGDVIRKARSMSNVTADVAAKAAGVSAADLAALEESGKPSGQINFAALGTTIGLNGKKLEELAKGWKPAEKDLSQWRELRMFTTTDDGITVNCFLVWDEVSREAALFDTGWDAAEPLKAIAENELQLKHIFLTHSHPDHIGDLAKVRQAFPKARVHTASKSAPPEQRLRANDFIMLGSLRVTNRDTPGHAEDAVTYLVGNWSEDMAHVAMVGDAIYAGSMGNGNGQWDLAKQKVREQIFTLPPDALICPGHGPITTVVEEKAHNPFF